MAASITDDTADAKGATGLVPENSVNEDSAALSAAANWTEVGIITATELAVDAASAAGSAGTEPTGDIAVVVSVTAAVIEFLTAAPPDAATLASDDASTCRAMEDARAGLTAAGFSAVRAERATR